MSQKPRLVDPVHFFDERGHALSAYERQEAEIAALRAENARLRSNLERINAILNRSRAANRANTPPRLHS